MFPYLFQKLRFQLLILQFPLDFVRITLVSASHKSRLERRPGEALHVESSVKFFADASSEVPQMPACTSHLGYLGFYGVSHTDQMFQGLENENKSQISTA